MALEKNIKIIFWGTPEFALTPLEALVKHGYEIAAVITNPDEPVGRKQILTSPPVKVFAKKHKIPVFQPVKLNAEIFQKEIPKADIYIAAAYGKIIPKEILEIPKFGSLVLHPSLLPRWRGPSPVQFTILNGDTKAGVTIIKMDELMDHGPILAKRELGISNFQFPISKITYRELHDRLAKLGAELLIETLPKWINGEIAPAPQDDAKATFSKILKKDDGRIDWSRPAEEIERKTRAFDPWPGSWTVWPSADKIYRIKIEEAEIFKEEPLAGSCGHIWQKKPNQILVKAKNGSLEIKKLILGGKKSATSSEFLRGYPQIIGTNFV